jgi:hypothetical protein
MVNVITETRRVPKFDIYVLIFIIHACMFIKSCYFHFNNIIDEDISPNDTEAVLT